MSLLINVVVPNQNSNKTSDGSVEIVKHLIYTEPQKKRYKVVYCIVV